MRHVVVITGASAGVGRATAEEFARHGCDVALLARNQPRLDQAAEVCRRHGARALAIAVDVTDAAALDATASRVEQELGPIDVWVNNAMATVFAPVSQITPEEFRRSTEVTYLGQVYGAMAALSRMRARNRGTIVNVGSALSYRAIPLQSSYCGAKYAVRGFTDALRSELIHDGLNVHLTMVHLPAVNTPQFDWALNKMPKRPQPVPPIFQPEVAARAIVFAAFHHRREVWVGFPTVKAILANRVIPGLLDRYLAKAGYTGQLSDETKPDNAPANLFETVPGPYGAHGRFDANARPASWEMLTSRHRDALAGAVAVFGLGIAVMMWGGSQRRGIRA
ncbi:MAG: SDR family oxidoreductase [Acetobacteraceae bacterium]|nr:SDR family oxidoreductase [Acetobacteraceae bacterium]